MQWLFPIALSAQMFIHAMLGCCWHRAHDCTRCKPEAGREAEQVAACCHHEHASPPASLPCTPGNCRYECQGTCTFVPVTKVQVEHGAARVVLDAAILPQPCVAAVVQPGWLDDGSTAPGGASLRLHLAHQVLLI